MARTANDITEAELAILQLLWDQGQATIRQLADQLYPDGTQAQYATVQKLLERLEGKDCVQRDRTQAPHVFVSTLPREELVGRRLQAMAEQLCGGSWTPLLTHLVHAGKLSAKDRQALRQLIDDLATRKEKP